MSSKQRADGSAKREFWQLAVETWRDSGMSVRRFCRAEGLSEAAFYWWRRQLTRAKASTAGRPNSTSAASPRPNNISGPFIELAIPRSVGLPLELVLKSGNVLRIDATADTAALSRVVGVLHEADLC